MDDNDFKEIVIKCVDLLNFTTFDSNYINCSQKHELKYIRNNNVINNFLKNNFLKFSNLDKSIKEICNLYNNLKRRDFYIELLLNHTETKFEIEL